MGCRTSHGLTLELSHSSGEQKSEMKILAGSLLPEALRGNSFRVSLPAAAGRGQPRLGSPVTAAALPSLPPSLSGHGDLPRHLWVPNLPSCSLVFCEDLLIYGGNGLREREVESKADSLLSVEPSVGWGGGVLDLMT